MLSVIKGYMQAKLGQRGAEMVEYAIVIACIATVGVAVYGAVGTDGSSGNKLITMINSLFDNAQTTVTNEYPANNG